jgi:hypothetical protein
MVDFKAVLEKAVKEEKPPLLTVPKPEELTREGRMHAYSVQQAAPAAELFGDDVGKNLPIKAGYNGPGTKGIAELLFRNIYFVSKNHLQGTPDWQVTDRAGYGLYTPRYKDIERCDIHLTERDKDGKFASRRIIELVTPEGALGKDFSHALHQYQLSHRLPLTDEINARTLQSMRAYAIDASAKHHDQVAKDAAPQIGGELHTETLDAFVRGTRGEKYDYNKKEFPQIPPRILNAEVTKEGILSDRDDMSAARSVEYAIKYFKDVVDPQKVPAVKKLVLDKDTYSLSTKEINGLQEFLGFNGDGGIGDDTLTRLEGLRNAIGKAEIANGDADLTRADVTQIVGDFLKTPATPSAKPAGKTAETPKR